MKDNFYAIRSKEGTAVIDIDNGCVQVFETWEHAVSSPKRKTDEIVAVTIKRVDSEPCPSDAETMIKALRALSRDIQSGDGVANACVSDAADMIESISAELAKANERVGELEALIQECDDYLDINRYTAIGNMSILHRLMKQLRKEQE